MRPKIPLCSILQTSVMRLRLLLAVSFFCCLSYGNTKDQSVGRPLAQGRRKGRRTEHRGRVPINGGYNGASVFIESYKAIQEPKPNYNVIPGNIGHCVFQGITMFDKTVWSPKPCVTCLCSRGEVVCDETQCPVLHCQIKFQPVGECCRICIDSVHDVSEISGDSPVPDDPSVPDAGIPHLPAQTGERRQTGKYKNAERKRRKKQNKEKERQRKQLEEQERYKDKELRRLQEEAEERAAAKAQQRLRAVDHDEEEEREQVVWLRDIPPLPTPYTLPQGCTISDVIVSCENAKLTSIPPLSIPELKSLNLKGNAITTIPAGAFNGILNLEWVDLGKNKISSSGIDPQAFKNLKFLTRMYMDGNLLEEIPQGIPGTLLELKINENNIHEIEENSFEGLNSLVTLEMEGNLLSEGNVNPKAFIPLNQLTYLRLGRNHFRMIPQGLPPSLQELHLENNLIEEISEGALNQSTNINVIVLRHNKIDESRIAPLAWLNHRTLESIDLSYNKLHLVPSFLPKSLVHLVLVGNQIERIPGYVFAHMEPGLEYLYLSYNKLDGDGVEPESFFGTFLTMTELCLDHNQLTSVPTGINEMTSLHFLRLNNNNIRHIGEDNICDPLNDEDLHLVALRLENNLIDPQKIPPTAFSCVRSYSSIILKPQRFKK
uniref:VWFC domain-containing protein n=1 Tax=Electrophorus electricus TaxID=8005 RepID=A0A4W4EXR5_ELEEL